MNESGGNGLVTSRPPRSGTRPPQTRRRGRSQGSSSSTSESDFHQRDGGAGLRPNRSEQAQSKSSRPKGSTNSIENAKRNYERYLALERVAASAGDAVEVENFRQHAEHYFRQMRERALQD